MSNKQKQFFNIINGISNFPVYYVVISCIKRADYITAFISVLAGTTSAVSHLAENHKHNLPGVLGVSRKQSYLLNRIDVLCVILTIIRISYIYYLRYGVSLDYFKNDPSFTFALIFSSSLNIISERFPAVANKPFAFTVFHSAWHISIFLLFHYFIEHV